MALQAEINVPTPSGQIPIKVAAASTVVFIGANGAGKTRLGVFLDSGLSEAGVEVHRIAAHRSLALNANVVPPSLEVATKRLFYGRDDGSYVHKRGNRYSGNPETVLLSDYDFVLAALYAENNDISIAHRQNGVDNPGVYIKPPPAKIDKLKSMWEELLPHRRLVVLGGNLKTQTNDGHEYSASDMSDGERVVFYCIGQALLANPDTVLIFDEPELHINRSILAKLWDSIESARPDCAFLYITHDVEFASSRHAATKYALRNFVRNPNPTWDIEPIPDGQELPDDVIATIIGSRRPVLFVEGDGGSLDSSLYRRVYRSFTVIPVGSCDQVIHTVASFVARPELHRFGCAGLIDADGRNADEAAYLEAKGVYCLPISEVENLLVLPNVFLAVAEALKFQIHEAQQRLDDLRAFLLAQANSQLDAISIRYTKRRIDAEMKKIGLTGHDAGSLEAAFAAATSGINVRGVYDDIRTTLSAAIAANDYEKVLLYYDNKGIFSEAARHLGLHPKALEEFIGRQLRSDQSSALREALAAYLPNPMARH